MKKKNTGSVTGAASQSTEVKSNTPLQLLADNFLETTGQATHTAVRKEYFRVIGFVLSDFISDVGNIPVGKVTTPQIQRVVCQPERNGRSRKRHLCVLKRFFSWARSEGYLDAGQPTPADPLHVAVLAHEPAIVTPNDLRMLLASTKDVESLLYLAISAFSGMRRGELERLSWDDIQPGQCIVMRPAMTLVRARRLVPILPVLDAWLRPFYGSKGLIFSCRVPQKAHQLARTQGVVLGSGTLRNSFWTYRVTATNNPNQTAIEMGRSPAVFLRRILKLVEPAAAAEFFSLTPHAVGLMNWPEMVARYLETRKTMQKGTPAGLRRKHSPGKRRK